MKKLYEIRLDEEIAQESDLGGKLDIIESIAWSVLKEKRDGGLLVPGQQYRIIDYVATTNGDMESRSANRPFDIIVTADDEKTLNERARAVVHEGDAYFADCDLAAWDVRYCVDNDAARFAWADTENGRGVIYRLVDEFQNDAPYDFKGIQFCRWAVTDAVASSSKLDAVTLQDLQKVFVKTENDGLFYSRLSSNLGPTGLKLVVDGSDSAWYYTFGGTEDLSRRGIADKVYGNKIAEYNDGDNKYRLNGVVFLGPECYSNTFEPGCCGSTFGAGCYYNTFGMDCRDNIFGAGCYYNTFGMDCHNNVFGTDCRYNTFGARTYKNTFGTACTYNRFDARCRDNAFGSGLYAVALGASCHNIDIGNNCNEITFGQSCSLIRFGTSSGVKSYCRRVRVDSGNIRLYINPTSTTSNSQYYQNVEIKKGVYSYGYKTIDDPNVGQTFLTVYKPSNSQEISL